MITGRNWCCPPIFHSATIVYELLVMNIWPTIDLNYCLMPVLLSLFCRSTSPQRLFSWGEIIERFLTWVFRYSIVFVQSKQEFLVRYRQGIEIGNAGMTDHRLDTGSIRIHARKTVTGVTDDSLLTHLLWHRYDTSLILSSAYLVIFMHDQTVRWRQYLWVHDRGGVSLEFGRINMLESNGNWC